MNLLKYTLLLLSLSSLSFGATSIPFYSKKQDRKLQSQGTKPAVVVMTCGIDQYKLAKNGYHIPTYLRCKNSQGDFYLYMLVPDHSTSTKTDSTSNSSSSTNGAEVKKNPETNSQDDSDDDIEELPDSSAVKPK